MTAQHLNVSAVRFGETAGQAAFGTEVLMFGETVTPVPGPSLGRMTHPSRQIGLLR